MNDQIQKLYDITIQQKECLEKEEVERFIELLEKRQVVLDTILEMKENQELSNEQLKVITEIKALDSENQVVYNQLFEEVKAKLSQIRKMKKHEQKYMKEYMEYSEVGIFGARK